MLQPVWHHYGTQQKDVFRVGCVTQRCVDSGESHEHSSGHRIFTMNFVHDKHCSCHSNTAVNIWGLILSLFLLWYVSQYMMELNLVVLQLFSVLSLLLFYFLFYRCIFWNVVKLRSSNRWRHRQTQREGHVFEFPWRGGGLPMFVWVPSRFSNFLPQSGRWPGDSKLTPCEWFYMVALQ